jgi:hypothetical protein
LPAAGCAPVAGLFWPDRLVEIATSTAARHISVVLRVISPSLKTLCI